MNGGMISTHWKERFPPLVIISGLVVGMVAGMLVKLGNPGNMGLCMACFQRDIAGALGLHRAGVVQYLRPEILGIVLGATLAALFSRELRAGLRSAILMGRQRRMQKRNLNTTSSISSTCL